jgi:hypothetical protein
MKSYSCSNVLSKSVSLEQAPSSKVKRSSKISQTLHLFASKHSPAEERRLGTNLRWIFLPAFDTFGWSRQIGIVWSTSVISAEFWSALISVLYLFLVLDMGNPRVGFTLPLPISVHTHTHQAWVRIFMGLCLGTDKGMEPKGMGKDFCKKNVNIY